MWQLMMIYCDLKTYNEMFEAVRETLLLWKQENMTRKRQAYPLTFETPMIVSSKMQFDFFCWHIDTLYKITVTCKS